MAGLDALVLSGGVDIAPSFYGGGDRYVKAPVDGWQPLREGFELSVLERAWELERAAEARRPRIDATSQDHKAKPSPGDV